MEPIQRGVNINFIAIFRLARPEQISDGFSVGKGYFGHGLTCISNDLGHSKFEIASAKNADLLSTQSLAVFRSKMAKIIQAFRK